VAVVLKIVTNKNKYT